MFAIYLFNMVGISGPRALREAIPARYIYSGYGWGVTEEKNTEVSDQTTKPPGLGHFPPSRDISRWRIPNLSLGQRIDKEAREVGSSWTTNQLVALSWLLPSLTHHFVAFVSLIHSPTPNI